MKKCIQTLAMCGFTLAATMTSIPDAQAQGSSGQGRVTSIIMQDGLVAFTMSQTMQNPDSCGNAGLYVRTLADNRASDRFLSSLTAAYLSGRQVEFWLVGCSTTAYWGQTRPLVNEMRFQ